MKKRWNEMEKNLQRKWSDLRKEIGSHKLVYILLAVCFVGGLFIRTYRTGQILGFYYDQGRDAKEIWELWHEGDFFLIGPTTGIAGIFRGPFYFYLIAPFYLLGGGNPLVPSYFLALLSMLAIVIMYYLGAKINGRTTGIFAAILGSFSFYIMVASRWLSNPTPMLLLSMLLLWNLFFLYDNNVKKLSKQNSRNLLFGWTSLSFIAGISLFHFGSSGEFFYFPALAIFALWQIYRRFTYNTNTTSYWSKLITSFGQTIGVKGFIYSLLAFLFTVSPLVLFDFLKGHILSQNIREFLFQGESFKTDFQTVFTERIEFYYSVFTSKLFHWIRTRELVLLYSLGLGFIVFLPKILKNAYARIVLLVMVSPLVGLLFFQGNFGNIYDYYLTGYYLIFLLVVAIVLGHIWTYKLGKLFIIFFFYVFISWNGMVTRYYIIAGVDGPETIAFGNQKQAIEWIYDDATGREFNVDVYVPPVIPHAYDYLFMWYGSMNKYYPVKQEQIELLYTLYEVDPPHPERLDEWLVRQQGIGSVEEEVSFGGITVQRRHRFAQ